MSQAEDDSANVDKDRRRVFDDRSVPRRNHVEFLEETCPDVEEDENEGTPRVLDPNHPLMEKFQKTLKEHLERQLDHLRNEIFELETGAKKKMVAREELGVEAYEAQQLVNKQQRDLEICVIELNNICAATEQMEVKLEEAKEVHTAKRFELFETEKKERHLRTEVEGLNLLMHQMKQWEIEIESELTINQRVFEKTKKDKFKLANEKRQQDLFVYKLMTEIWRLEEELETIDMQLRVKEEEREKLAETVTASNIDIESMTSELRCLLQAWNSIVIMITHRDKHYDNVKHELDALNEKLFTISAEIEQTKKLCHKEMLQNEKLTNIKSRIETDVENSNRLLESEKKKRDALEKQMNDNQMMVDQIETDIGRISAENANKNNELACLVRDFEKVSQEKVDCELEILRTLEDQLTNHKAAKYLNKLVYQTKEKNRDLEISLATLENLNGKAFMDIEAQKCMNDETQRFIDEIIKHENIVETESKERAHELERLLCLASKKQREIDVLTTKIETAIKRQGGLEISPEELKILTLERGIDDVKERSKELQNFWMRQQVYVVSLSQQRQDQINDMNMLKKQMTLLIQKNLKITDELEAHKKLEDKMTRLIYCLQNRLVTLNDEQCKKKGHKDNLCKYNDTMQSDYVAKLQESEMESLKIEADIADIEEDKINLSDELVELNREALAWEKKIQMAVETKKSMESERGEGGEVENMKAEIHRMNVRLSHLKKAQDKLVQDLEHCISRRDALLTIAGAREKKEKGGSEKTRINFTRKLDDMRNNITKMRNEIEELDQTMEVFEEEESKFREDIAIRQAEIEQIHQKAEKEGEKIEEKKTLQQRNLEVLVLKQKKLKVYSELSKNRCPYIVYKTDSTINMECDKHTKINSNLLVVLENLLSDYPNHLQVLTRIHNTLKLPLIYL